MSHTYVIGEFGSCHDGSLQMALDGVRVARDAGCDAFKLQYWSSAARLAERRGAPEYEAVYAKYQVSPGTLSIVASACRELGIDFMATTYLPEDIRTVAPHVAKFKVASFEALDTRFILDHVPYSKDIIVSTGMMDEAETWKLVDLRDTMPELAAWMKLLHCVSAYPASPESLNLAVIRKLGLDGFSDHTGKVITGAYAVIAGAQIVEVHFRLDETSSDNPDYPHSHEPRTLGRYVGWLREAELILGDGVKVATEGERAMMKYRVTPP